MEMEKIKELISRYKRGDTEAFDIIARQKMKYLFNYTYLYLKNYDDALDAVQNVFIKLLKSLKKFDETAGSFDYYLKKVAFSVIMDIFRKKDNFLPLKDEFYVDAPVENDDSEERMEILSNVIKSLSRKHQAVILLRIEGNSVQEIAQILGISEGTVLSRLFYARQKIARTLKRGGII